jgi:hypothetical protein
VAIRFYWHFTDPAGDKTQPNTNSGLSLQTLLTLVCKSCKLRKWQIENYIRAQNCATCGNA